MIIHYLFHPQAMPDVSRAVAGRGPRSPSGKRMASALLVVGRCGVPGLGVWPRRRSSGEAEGRQRKRGWGREEWGHWPSTSQGRGELAHELRSSAPAPGASGGLRGGTGNTGSCAASGCSLRPMAGVGTVSCPGSRDCVAQLSNYPSALSWPVHL